MKKITLIMCLSSFVFFAKLRADLEVIEGMAYEENKNIRIYADVGKKHSLEISDGAAPKETGEWWTVRAYIQNAGKQRVGILLGRDTNVLIAKPDKTSASVTYEISSDTGVSGFTIKPPISDLRLVELDPGEVAQLPVANVQLTKKGTLKKMQIGYSVGEDFAKWFNVWAGEITLVLDKDHPPKKVGISEGVRTLSVDFSL
ncbi:hypothetical protein M2103_002257 [Ereboglobus sp. PH5-5]|uniref:hypothetical protein n=1 Tax=Ereboglobus sp. PH5-5 TaxID=2940529 RepID=UPI00240601D3|nr:hypothetical protein [Ereboglobus sp. PH5-5]MDF9834022.1 hypothetical protein [Ereboglobus sp. PH5-5]